MAKHKYVVQRGGKRFGPFSSRQLRELARQAKLKPDDIVSYEGASEGVPARAVRGLFEGAANPNKVQSEPPSVVPSGALTSLSPTERTPIAPLTTVTPSTSTRRTGGLVAAAIGIAIVLGIALGGYVAIIAIRGRDGTASVATTGRADAGFDKAEKAKASTVANRPQKPSVDEPGSSEPADATDAGAATPRRPDHAPVQGDVPIAPTKRSAGSSTYNAAESLSAPIGIVVGAHFTDVYDMRFYDDGSVISTRFMNPLLLVHFTTAEKEFGPWSANDYEVIDEKGSTYAAVAINVGGDGFWVSKKGERVTFIEKITRKRGEKSISYVAFSGISPNTKEFTFRYKDKEVKLKCHGANQNDRKVPPAP